MLKKLRKAGVILKNEGINGVVQHIKRNQAPPKIDVFEFYDFVMDRKKADIQSTQNTEGIKDGDVKLLNWVIPEMGVGSGGHINIFRFVSLLEERGFHSRIFLHRSTNFSNDETLGLFLREYFPILDQRVEAYCDVSAMTFAHATIATAWQTAYYVNAYDNTISKFYFVQDFEPYFYPLGSDYKLAEATYQFGLRGITAGNWLKEKLSNEYHMEADSFGFSYEKELYTPQKKTDDIKRVFFYARPVTPRRDFEIGMLALNELCKRMPDVEVVFAGWDISNYLIPFRHRSLGIVAIENLSKEYAQCDLCLILSNTNLSLLPLEVMASNSVVVSSIGRNNTWLVNEENAILVDYDPINIANVLEFYLENSDKLDVIREKGLLFAQQTSWEKEADKVQMALTNGIEEDEKK